MILYLSSQKFGNNKKFLENWISKYNNKILLIFNALDAKGKDKIDKAIKEDTCLLENIGFNVDVIDLKDYFDKSDKLEQECKKYNAFCVMGGNVFVLRSAMKYSGFDRFLKNISNDDNYLYIGYSAGSIVLTRNIDVFKMVDEPVDFYKKNEIIYDGLNLINYIFVPHYKSNYHKAYLIDEIVKECEKDKLKYKTFKDGESIIENINKGVDPNE